MPLSTHLCWTLAVGSTLSVCDVPILSLSLLCQSSLTVCVVAKYRRMSRPQADPAYHFEEVIFPFPVQFLSPSLPIVSLPPLPTSASEVTTLRRYTNLFIIIIIPLVHHFLSLSPPFCFIIPPLPFLPCQYPEIQLLRWRLPKKPSSLQYKAI